MRKHTKLFIIFALLILTIMMTRFYFEYQNIQELKIKIVKEEAKSLSAFMMAFRQTYQKTFVHNKIPIDEKTINLLPVRTTKDIGDTFSQIMENTTKIKTVSDRPRNILNKANKQEMKIINYFNNNKQAQYYFENSNNEIFYYAKPLYVKKGCLKCHGKKEDAIKTISDSYDAAYDYKVGDLRGILSVKISKNEIIEKIDSGYERSMYVATMVYILFLLSLYTMIKIIIKNENEYTNTLEKRIQEEVRKNKEIQTHLFKAEKMASMGEMIGNIAHQWRQPLSVISTSSTGMVLQKQCDILSDDDFYQSCENINKNTQYLSRTIDDFQDYIRGNRTLVEFVVSDTIKSFLHLIESSIKSNNIKVILDLQEDIKYNGYPNELTQCLINIVNNARDVLESQKLDENLIFITTLIQNNNLIIKIKDNAGGIPENILPKIFEPYFTTKHQSQGTGLGLHMTYNLIVDGMDGKIEAKNINYEYNDKSYIGAEFIISLPIK